MTSQKNSDNKNVSREKLANFMFSMFDRVEQIIRTEKKRELKFNLDVDHVFSC